MCSGMVCKALYHYGVSGPVAKPIQSLLNIFWKNCNGQSTPIHLSMEYMSPLTHNGNGHSTSLHRTGVHGPTHPQWQWAFHATPCQATSRSRWAHAPTMVMGIPLHSTPQGVDGPIHPPWQWSADGPIHPQKSNGHSSAFLYTSP